jgi:DNA adenine methylase
MRYLGGKAKIRKELCAEIAKFRKPGQIVWEPFCGGLNSAVGHGGAVFCSDSSLTLISLFQAVAAGWDPPEYVSEETYRAAHALPETDPLHGFCACCCSFGGRPWIGYAGYSVGHRMPGGDRRILLRDVPKISWFACLNFLALVPRPTGLLIYCDPPYRGRTGYSFDFDHDLFKRRCREWARYTTVLVSEYDFPGRLIWERRRDAPLRGKETAHTERLYLVEP